MAMLSFTHHIHERGHSF